MTSYHVGVRSRVRPQGSGRGSDPKRCTRFSCGVAGLGG